MIIQNKDDHSKEFPREKTECTTMASNIDLIQAACVLFEQKLDREMLIFARRHHMYELTPSGTQRTDNKPRYSTLKKVKRKLECEHVEWYLTVCKICLYFTALNQPT